MINIKTQQFIWWLIILIIIIILIKITPFYNYPFDKITQDKQQIISYSPVDLNKNQWFLSFEWKSNQNIQIQKWINYFPIVLENSQKISFPAKNIFKDTYIFIQLTGNIIKISPQSAIYIQNSNNNIEIKIINWTIQYLNLNKNNKITFQWQIVASKLDINDEILNSITKDQKIKEKTNIIELYWWNIILNNTFDYIIHNLIILFSKINPKQYNDNLQNYNNFKNYINNINQTKPFWINLNFKKNEKTNINNDIFKQVKKWRLKTVNSF